MSYTILNDGVYECRHPDAWWLIYHDGEVKVKGHGGFAGSGIHTIVDFETEELRDQAILDMGLTDLPEE